jgi:DNA anti-recombination protein RmuC
MNAPSSLAQMRTPTSNEGFQSNEQNVNGFGNSGFDPLSLIHNANFSRSRNSSDFADDTNQSLNKAAQEFKRQQQQQLQQLSAPSAVSETDSPAPNKP